MRKDVVYLAVIVILLGIVVVLTCTKPESYDQEAFLYKDSIKTLQARKRILIASIDSVVKMSNYKAKISDSLLTIQEREIIRLTRRASIQRPKVQPLIDLNPELKVFVEAQDSVIHQQSVLIDTLKSQVAFERNVREQLVSLHYDSDKISASLQELSEQRIIGLENDLRKERRKGRFLKVVAIVGSVAAFIGGSQL